MPLQASGISGCREGDFRARARQEPAGFASVSHFKVYPDLQSARYVAWTPKSREVMEFWAISRGFELFVLHTVGVQVAPQSSCFGVQAILVRAIVLLAFPQVPGPLCGELAWSRGVRMGCRETRYSTHLVSWEIMRANLQEHPLVEMVERPTTKSKSRVLFTRCSNQTHTQTQAGSSVRKATRMFSDRWERNMNFWA